jgi:hypothetical protein
MLNSDIHLQYIYMPSDFKNIIEFGIQTTFNLYIDVDLMHVVQKKNIY